MANGRPTSEDFSVGESTLSDLDSLSTVVARSFHPVNDYIQKTLPDTPLVRDWWKRTFNTGLSQQPETCHVLKLTSSSSTTEETVLGILLLRLMRPETTGAITITTHPITPDHDREQFDSMIGAMITADQRLLGKETHFMVELFGVDHAYKGRKLGQMLLHRACEIADQAGLPSFVQANASAKGFYERLGFEVRDVVVMPGESGYMEFMLVRPAKKGRV